MDEEIQTEPLVERPSRATRLRRSIAARLRRKEVKGILSLQFFKEEHEARKRLKAKRQMAKLHKKRLKKLQESS